MRPYDPVAQPGPRDTRKLTRHRLELGAGGGLVGLAVARGCATGAPLYVTDQLEMLALMEHNIGANGLDGRARARILNW